MPLGDSLQGTAVVFAWPAFHPLRGLSNDRNDVLRTPLIVISIELPSAKALVAISVRSRLPNPESSPRIANANANGTRAVESGATFIGSESAGVSASLENRLVLAVTQPSSLIRTFAETSMMALGKTLLLTTARFSQ